MLFIETATFTRQIITLLSDNEYATLQAFIAIDPERAISCAVEGAFAN